MNKGVMLNDMKHSKTLVNLLQKKTLKVGAGGDTHFDRHLTQNVYMILLHWNTQNFII